jgi:hypothetical protein
MPTPTYTLIDSVTLTSSAASVTFSSISATGKGDLVLVINGTNGNALYGLRFNGDSGSNYSYVQALGDGSSTISSSGTEAFARIGYSGTNTLVNVTTVMDYSATDKHKSVLSRDNVPSASVRMIASRWANTAAITSLTAYVSASWNIGSTFHLYQIVSE